MREPWEFWFPRTAERIIATVAVQVYEKNFTIDVIVTSDVPRTVIGDARPFSTIAVNLISNAIKFTARGGVCVRIDLASEEAEYGYLCKVIRQIPYAETVEDMEALLPWNMK